MRVYMCYMQRDKGGPEEEGRKGGENGTRKWIYI